ncbi:MAG: GldG family protein [Oscillospiraceae bacterium]|nr:GldG family protein [Oscillospiraceae bacterium]
MKKLLNSRTFRQGSAATAITAIAIAMIVVLNMVVTSLSERYILSIDLTENNLFSISEESKSFLRNLDKDVTIYVLSSEEAFLQGNVYSVQANEVLKRYALESPRVHVEYVDLLRNPAFESRFPDLQLNPNTILVTSGGKVRDLTPYQLYNIESYQGQMMIASSQAEQAMTSAMLNVTSDKTVGVAFLTGHNETELPTLQALFELNNYTVTHTNLLTEEIDPESVIAVLAAPKRDLDEDALKKLDDYLSNDERLGRTLVYFSSIEQPEPSDMPNISAFLRDWGIAVENSVVFEASLNKVAAFNMYAPYTEYAEAEYSEATASRNLWVFMPFSKPLSVVFESGNSISTEVLLAFSQTSGVLPEDAEADWQPSESDLTGPTPALVLARQIRYDGTTQLRSNVAAVSSVFAVSSDALSATSTGNGDYFINLFNKLSNREDIVNIQSKAIGGKELGIQSEQALVLALVFVILLPLAVLIYGVVVWLRRRHR